MRDPDKGHLESDKKKASVKSKVPGKAVQGSTDLAKTFKLQTTWL